ncbi:MAG: FAD-dependent oxidoreductase [Actinobacteria bacterium]|nr:FAD-dependent oxidoreductase [Actinomycetota bacterium]
MRIVILGAGFGGLEVATRLVDAIGGQSGVEIVLIDRSEAFVAGADHIDFLAGRASLADVRHPFAESIDPRVRFVHSDVHRIDVAHRLVETTEGSFEADVLVVALGAELDVAATPGLAEAGHEFYSVPGVLAARRALDAFEGGQVVIGVCGTPYKCPPAPAAATLAIHDVLVQRRVAKRTEVTLVMPTARPIPPSPDASDAVLAAFDHLAITWRPETGIERLDPARRVAMTTGGDEIPFELFFGVPVHRAPDVVIAAGLCTDGWVRVDPATMETAHSGVYAVGDLVDIGAPKAGVFALAQAAVVAASVVARFRGEVDPVRGSDTGVCYLDIGRGRTNAIEVTFEPGGATNVVWHGPSPAVTEAKARDALDRVRRWFPREIGDR